MLLANERYLNKHAKHGGRAGKRTLKTDGVEKKKNTFTTLQKCHSAVLFLLYTRTYCAWMWQRS